ncbi:MAG: flagellar basal body-associated FliL family protein [Sphingomonadaceae bacterium]|nr:flagellar basal body-associated FliL family protein [Sphingomonadaceae bacterium]
MKKLILLLVALIVIGGGAAGGYFAMGGFRHHADEPNPDLPQLVVKEGVSDETAAAARVRARGGHPDPHVFQSTYVPLEGNFTSNLRGGDAFVQVGLGVSTYYDTHVTENVTRNMMAIRSAVIMTLSEADPIDITTFQGKQRLKEALKNAINAVLTNREGFGGIDEVYFTSFVTQ